jgi:NAD(P)H-hydrate epimerase
LYRAEQLRRLDEIAIGQLDIPGFSLMQNAAAAALEVALECWPNTRSIIVFAGAGNNGGDGYVLAAMARDRGLDVNIVQLAATGKLQGDAARAAEFAAQCQVPMLALADSPSILEAARGQCLLVDALFGTGLSRAPEGDYAEAIALINAAAGLPVLAMDIPSGLAADTGMPLGTAVRADLTVSFIAMKKGMLTAEAGDYCGEIVFSDLDVPAHLYSHPDAPVSDCERIDIHSASAVLKPRRAASHKGSNGHVLVLGGELGFGGAVIMAAEAAARSGAGLVSIASRAAHRQAALSRCPVLMFHGLDDDQTDLGGLVDRASVIVIGPGLGRSDWSRHLFQQALAAQRQGTPLVVDADALHLLAERKDQDSSLRRQNWVLTPHPGEAAALLDSTVAQVQSDRFAALAQLSRLYGGVCLLKGSGSLIMDSAAPEKSYLCSEGNAGMGSGGMGDILSGLIAGLIAQGLSLSDALRTAVCIHGEAADMLAAEKGQRGLLATDLLEPVQQLVNPGHRDLSFHD